MKKTTSHNMVFENRFNINVDSTEAQQRFVNRLFNKIDKEFLQFTTIHCHLQEYVRVFKYIATKLGFRYTGNNYLEYYSGKEFIQVLRTIEALYEGFTRYPYGYAPKNLDDIIGTTLAESEIDLEIRWAKGHFYRSGAKLLDNDLVVEPLKWLDNPKYVNVLTPFNNGLKSYMEANKDQSKLDKVATDMYEALEALMRIICNNNSNMNDNIDEFVAKLNLTDNYKRIIKEYGSYANRFRHAGTKDKPKEIPNTNEIEASIYLTGLFIRLAMNQVKEQ